ncbi:MAG: SMC-Scp complex subunit ScpB [Candidatus Pacebacteria bacterium]|nr:SMC-Scp complex subunit ScpB [Candidatus Paceibacterota bacterium]
MNTESVIESLLFVSGEPISFKKLGKITLLKEKELKLLTESLAKKYTEEKKGLRILIKNDRVQMVTAGENREFVEQFLKFDMNEDLSKAALEVLSVVAYRGPIARSEIEEIRGVNCSFTLRHLMIRGLIEKINNPKDARAYLYRISFDFLKKLGLEKVEDLPKFGELREKELFKKINSAEVESDNSEKENIKTVKDN